MRQQKGAFHSHILTDEEMRGGIFGALQEEMV